ncbi:MAG TPA: CDP-alcohol phosphatidyltransferase family protein [Candidatus Limnocylindrales bacterium]|nr:CDP-alcohol phosphatidyltransferase family protein [Candidatus Limnocylindrales bacterium]
MKLHRVGKKADWDKLKARNRNNWQRLAVKTHGIITPGNIISVVGFVLVVTGLWYIYNNHTILGVMAVLTGRVLDIADGILADKTGTKSPLGEVIDASIDKLEIALALPVMVISAILLPWQAIVLVVQHLANVIFAGITKARGILPHASRSGKYATTAQWGSVVLYGIAKANLDHIGLRSTGHVIFGLSVVLGLMATAGYAKNAFKKI